MGRFASEGSSCLRVDQYRVRSGNGLERRREWRVEVCQGCGGFFGLETGLLPVLGLEHLPVAGGRALALVVLGLLGVFGIACGGDEVAVGLVEDGEADLGGSAFGDWVELVGVGAGDLKAVEEQGGELGVDAVLRQGGDDEGECDLDGVAVLQLREIERGNGLTGSARMGSRCEPSWRDRGWRTVTAGSRRGLQR